MIRIARRELAQLLTTPAGWLLAAGSQFVLAWWFLTLVERYRMDYQSALVRIHSELGATDLISVPYLGGLPLLALLVVVTAVLGMRGITEERRRGTIELLLGSPRPALAIVTGKYFGALAYLTLVIALWGLMPASLSAFTTIDAGRLAAGLLGLWLSGAALLALSLFAASLTEQAGVGALIAFGFGLLLMLVSGETDRGVLGWFGLPSHYRDFLQGIVDTGHIAYFLLMTAAGLALTTWRLDRLRDG